MTTSITDNPNGNDNWYGVLAIVAAFIMTFMFGVMITTQHYKRNMFSKTVVDTTYVTVVDTVNVIQPILRDSVVVRYETIPVIVPDTVVDTVYYQIPIEQKVYEDSLYKAWVSGYHPKLDSINIYRKTVYQTIERTTTVYKKDKKWGIGLQAGYGIGKSGTSPYVGIGVSYDFLTW